MERLSEGAIRFALGHPLAVGVLTIAAVVVGGLLALARAIQLGAEVGPWSPLVGSVLGLFVIVVWLDAGLRHEYTLTRAQWIVTLVGQVLGLVAGTSLLNNVGAIPFQAACAGYLSAFLLALVPGLVVGLRQSLRDPQRGLIGAAHAFDALFGLRHRQ